MLGLDKKNKVKILAKNNTQQKRHHPVLVSLILILVFFGVFYAWGSWYYQSDRQITRLLTTLSSPSQDLSADVQPTNPDIQVTKEKLTPLQSYFKENKQAKKQLLRDFHKQQSSSQISIVRAGEHFFLFPKYVLRVAVYRPQVETNHANSILTVDGRKYGKMEGGGQNYYQDLGLAFPGRYHFLVQTTVSGRKLKTSAITNVWSNKTINLKIKTGTFQIRSVPNGLVYINDKKVKRLNKNGQASFVNYPLAKDTELYIETKYAGKKIKSEKVKDLSSAIDSDFKSDDSTGDYGAEPYAGNEEKDVYQDVEGDYIVNPLWKGLINKQEAGHLLFVNYQKPQSEDFEQGKDDENYHQLKKLLKKQHKTLKLKSVQVIKILPIGNYSSSVDYQLVYRVKGKKKKTKKVSYENAIFHQVQGKQLIQKLGTKK